MGLSVNILTSGFLVTVVIFFVLMGILFLCASSKMGQVLEEGDDKENNLEKLDSAFNSVKVAYILAFIAAGLSLLLAVLYAGHESVISPSEYWHLTLYLIVYALMVISVIYGFIALNKLYDLEIRDKNGADAYIWAGLLMAIFAFVGLTATGSGRLGMNAVRKEAVRRVQCAENVIHEHLPSIHSKVEDIRSKMSVRALQNVSSGVTSLPSSPSSISSFSSPVSSGFSLPKLSVSKVALPVIPPITQ